MPVNKVKVGRQRAKTYVHLNKTFKVNCPAIMRFVSMIYVKSSSSEKCNLLTRMILPKQIKTRGRHKAKATFATKRKRRVPMKYSGTPPSLREKESYSKVAWMIVWLKG